jgi:O-succinylbenzoate synthase
LGQMGRRFFFQSYQRSFVNPLRTARGAWATREGFIVRVADETGVGYGEVAPLPEFGTESVEAAHAFLQRLVQAPELAQDAAALAALPCCAFALSTALTSLSARGAAARRDYPVAALLPAGRAAISAARAKAAQGYSTFKWKIGVAPVEAEQALFCELIASLPAAARLRLDANCGLSVEGLEAWLHFLQAHRTRIEYLEQPLPVGEEAAMAHCAAASGIALALDESLNGAQGARWLQAGAWSGPLVVKPALAGDARVLLQRLRPLAAQVVLSSVFETQVGVENALQLADQLPGLNRPIGFDTFGAFRDTLCTLRPAALIRSSARATFCPQTLWQQLLHST